MVPKSVSCILTSILAIFQDGVHMPIPGNDSENAAPPFAALAREWREQRRRSFMKIHQSLASLGAVRA
eukprot:COSAG02_NODE_1852_length_10661_cov_3.072429_3_plen_68_part_00